jgi:hypothetical protein
MKIGRIGVWFSLALTILVLSAWLGSKLGEKVAVYRYRSAQSQSLGNLSDPERKHLESVLDDLDAIEFLRTTFLFSLNEDKPKMPLPEQLRNIDAFRRKVKTAEAKPIMDMNLALANVVAAIVEERQSNKDRAAVDMASAQALYRSLGWRDCSEATLNAVAQHELQKWLPNPPKSEHAK